MGLGARDKQLGCKRQVYGPLDKRVLAGVCYAMIIEDYVMIGSPSEWLGPTIALKPPNPTTLKP